MVIMYNWQDIIGHEQIKQDLQMLTACNKLPHALMFAGIEGVGKLLMAETLAKTLLCENNIIKDNANYSSNSNCNCSSCRAFINKNHPDYFCLQPEGKAIKMIKIEQIRRMQESIALAPYLADKRVVIIDGAEYMNDVAANSLLKTLEEPVGQIYFILLTTNKEMLLSTILSRCMKLYFAPLTDVEVAKVLQNKQNIDLKNAKIAAKLSGGSVSKAMRFLEEDALSVRQLAVEFLSKEFTAREIWSISDELGAMERAKVSQWAGYLQMLVRDLLLVDVEIDDSLLYNSDIKNQLIELKNRFDIKQLFRKLTLIEDLIKKLNSNADVKLMIQKFILQWSE